MDRHFIVAAALVAFSATSLLGQSYTISRVDSVRNFVGTDVTGLDADGQAVGNAGTVRGFTWRGSRGAHVPVGLISGGETRFEGIDERGNLVGSAQVRSGAHHATIWTRESQGAFRAIDLGTAPGHGASLAETSNGKGLIVGCSDDFFSYHAAVWDLHGKSREPVLLPERMGHVSSLALDVNRLGTIVGQSAGFNAGSAMVWTRPAGVWQFQTLPSLMPGADASAGALNDAGQIVGWAIGSSGLEHAVLWERGTATDLGRIAGLRTIARDINASGTIVGDVWPPVQAAPWVRAPGGRMVNLNTLLPAGSPWQLLTANAINDRGQIAGMGVLGGQTYGYVLTPARNLLVPPTPGLAGQVNDLIVTGLEPFTYVQVHVALGGGERKLLTCEMRLDLDQPVELGIVRASARGDALLSLPVPAALAGVPLYFQVVTQSCEVGVVLPFTF